MKLKKKTSRSIKIKANRNQKNEDQTQNKYKIEVKTKFFKAKHENQDLCERNEWQEKKPHCHRTATFLGARVTPTAAPYPCTSNETTIGFFLPPYLATHASRIAQRTLMRMHASSYFTNLLIF